MGLCHAQPPGGQPPPGASLLLGIATRAGAALALWLMVMFATGGYYEASLIPLRLIAALLIVLPTGHWLGTDRRLHQKHPRSIWLRWTRHAGRAAAHP